MKKTFLLFLSTIALYSCGADVQKSLPCDPMATPQTVNLYNNLKKMAAQAPMLGHQDALAYGVGWKEDYSRCDFMEAGGDYPAVFGWDLGHIELGNSHNLDSVSFERMVNHVKKAYSLGGVNTFSWHLNNPLTGGDAWDVSSDKVVESILVGGENHEKFVGWLDKLADFMLSLKADNGEMIPVIFRPYHELSGSWFWWGRKLCTVDQFKELWKFTADYLRETKGVHNMLLSFSTSADFGSVEEFLERYPGDEYVDMLGFDNYQMPNNKEAFVTNTNRCIDLMNQAAVERNKISALTELGFEKVPDEKWFSETLLPIMKGKNLSYVLLWRNAYERPEHYYVPYVGHSTAADFKATIDAGGFLTASKVNNIYK